MSTPKTKRREKCKCHHPMPKCYWCGDPMTIKTRAEERLVRAALQLRRAVTYLERQRAWIAFYKWSDAVARERGRGGEKK